MKITEYKIVKARDQEYTKNFVEAINGLIKDGWVPLGGPSSSGGGLVQAMVIYNTEQTVRQPSNAEVMKMYNRDFSWECNECGSQEFTSAVSEDDVHDWLACSSCGGTEFHKHYHESGDDIGNGVHKEKE